MKFYNPPSDHTFIIFGGRPVWLAGDELATKNDQMVDELAGEASTAGSKAIPLFDSSRCGTPHRRTATLVDTLGNQAHQPRVVLDSLVNHYRGPARQRPGEDINLPAPVRCGVDEPTAGCSGLLTRSGHENPGLRRRPWPAWSVTVGSASKSCSMCHASRASACSITFGSVRPGLFSD